MKSQRSAPRAGDIFLFTDRTGNGEPILLVSGLGYSSWCWDEVRVRLGADYTVVTFDNRGTGRSEHPPGPYSMDMLADDAARVLDGHGVGSAHVLGHSMGGYISLTLARRHPARVRSLVLCCTAPGGTDRDPLPEETRAAWRAAIGMSPAANVRATMPLTFSRGWTEAHPAEFDAIVKRRIEFPTPPECWQAQYDACVEYFRSGIDVERIRVPALVIHGEDDRIVPVGHGRELARRLPNNRYVELPGQGHLPYLEDPDGFVSLVREHLQGTI